ncbi:FAD-binding molybdopterin dehydrogenase [Chimaeribacter coloradensis]|uniref:FAD-binding molybdopterin dehydrogenase n=1 Tax=Chimaeribacter coloradensis TaxID=2060068 RepID=A0A2N5E4W6_9GAMM|nr:xanthine dehydrogenase family protein subunit M [Chimaeribacter coloradensis]PLR36032.1 FAD-binding molybdopterin dehydrogenase [Chimaeribacter coloradensis]
MKAFDYQRATDLADAQQQAAGAGSRFLAGGTTQLDLMKCEVERPERLVDITHLPGLDAIHVTGERILLGSLAKMSRVADHPQIRATAPAVADSLALAASAQLRNMATLGGNLLQRTRCSYFRDPQGYDACNKRNPGSGCAALDGLNRNHAVLGTSAHCIATYPGDLAVALTAFDAVLHLRAPDGSSRQTPIATFFWQPGDRPDLEHDLAPGELITAIEIPVTAALKRSHYLKVRDRASYEFAAASAAVGLELAKDNTIAEVQIAVGGVATVPWRAREVEQALRGQPFDEAVLRQAAETITQGAVAHQHNGYKLTLLPRVIARALMIAGGLA